MPGVFNEQSTTEEDTRQPLGNQNRKSNKKKKKLEKDIQGSVKTKRKVSNLLKKFETLEKKSSEMEGTSSRAKRLSKKSKKGSSSSQNHHIDIDLASSADDDESGVVDEEEKGQESLMELNDGSESEEDSISEEGPKGHPSMKKFQEKMYYRKLDPHSLLVSISPYNNLYISGKCSVKVLKGAVEICGYQMNPSHPIRQVFSPKSLSSLLYIKGISRQSEFDTEEIEEEFQDVLTLEEVQDLPGAVLVMKAFDNEWAQGLRHFLPHGETLVGPNISGMGPGKKLPKMKTFMEKMGFQFVPQFMKEKSRLFETSPVWDQVFGTINSSNKDTSVPSRICLFGGKGVGKSTFTRWMVNKFLSSGNKAVLYIDLDPGQAEFTAPGVVSVTICDEPLFGPNFTHLRQPTRAIFLGGVSVSDFPVSYLNALVQLFEFASGDDHLARIPWIINTMGFTQGLGVHLAVGCIKIFRPSDVIQLSINSDRRSYPFNLNSNNVKNHRTQFLLNNLPAYTVGSHYYRFFNVESVCNRVDGGSNDNPWGGSPKSLRENVMASYFAELIGSTNDCSFLSVLPYNVSLKEVSIGTMNSELTYEGVLRSLIGNLVALCEFHLDVVQETASDSDLNWRISKRGFIQKAERSPNTFYGYGIVRAYDEERKVLHIVSPLNEGLKTRINAVIVAGSVGLPIQFYVGNVRDKSDPSGVQVPYVLNMKEGQSKLHTASKKYFVQKRVTHSVLRNSLL